MLHHCYDLNQSPHDTNGVEKKEGIEAKEYYLTKTIRHYEMENPLENTHSYIKATEYPKEHINRN